MNNLSLASLRVYLSPWLHISTGGISLIMIGSIILAGTLFQINWDQGNQIKANITQVSAQIRSLQYQQQQLVNFELSQKKHIKTFSEFQKRRFEDSLMPEHIHLQFQRWQKAYKIESLSLKFGSQNVYQKDLKLWTVPVTVNLKLLQDHQFYQLLERVQQELPGKVVLKNFSLKRNTPLTPHMLHQISQGKKDVNMFEGKIEFDWVHYQAEKTPANNGKSCP